MIQKENLIKIGILTKSHGILGEVLIRLIPELVGTEPDPSWLFVDVQGGLVPFEVLSVRTKGDDALLLGLDTISNDEKAKRYQGADVYIDPKDLADEKDSDEINLNTLIGYSVVDRDFGPIGVISAIHEIKQNPLAEIDYQGKSVLVPLQEDFIVSLDRSTRLLVIKAPSGLIDLYLE